MDGPQIVALSISRTRFADRYGNLWQYHPQSERYSKVACWTILFEMLQHSARLRRHVEDGRVICGVNKELRDAGTDRTKKLDLVIAIPTPSTKPVGERRTLGDLAKRWGVQLSADQQRELAQLPPMVEGTTSRVLVTLEAKATMTDHVKARPRLFDELSSSHLTIHANADGAIAAAFAVVNAAPYFVNPKRNPHNLSNNIPVVNWQPQPQAAIGTIAKLKELPRRTSQSQEGFDALGIVVVAMDNDGTPARVVETPPAPEPGDVFHYDQMLTRLVHLYETNYAYLG